MHAWGAQWRLLATSTLEVLFYSYSQIPTLHSSPRSIALTLISMHDYIHACIIPGGEIGGWGAWAPPPPTLKGGGLSPLIFQKYILLIYFKKPQNYCQKASEALSGGWIFQILLGGMSPHPSRWLMVLISEGWVPSLLQGILRVCVYQTIAGHWDWFKT